jgi:uncharacterized protein (DUF983 family)
MVYLALGVSVFKNKASWQVIAIWTAFMLCYAIEAATFLFGAIT